MAGPGQDAVRLFGGAAALSDEQRVLLACQSGDWSDYGLLVERYRRLVWAAVDAVIAEKDEVPDVVQEVFIRAYQKLSSFRHDSAFSSWLYRLARNHAVSHLRGRMRRLRPESLDAADPLQRSVLERIAGTQRPEGEYMEQARQRELSRLLERLEESYREVINLHYLGEYGYEEIGELLGLPVNTVKTRLRRAKLRLVELADKGGWR